MAVVRPALSHAIVFLFFASGAAASPVADGDAPRAATAATAAVAPSPAAQVEAAAPPLVRALVLPFTAKGDREPDWMSAGIAAFLAEAVGSAGHPVVGPEERQGALEAAGLDREQRLSLATECTLARELGARHLLSGTWEVHGQVLSVHARVIDVEGLRLLDEASAEAPVGELGRLLASVAQKLLGDLGLRGASRASLERLATTPMSGLVPWMQAAAEPDLARSHLAAALEAQPDLIPARLDLAEVLLDAGEPEKVPVILDRLPATQSTRDGARADALRGRSRLALGDPGTAVTLLTKAVAAWLDRDGLLWLGEAQLATGDRAGAAATAVRALELAPSDAEALGLAERARTAG